MDRETTTPSTEVLNSKKEIQKTTLVTSEGEKTPHFYSTYSNPRKNFIDIDEAKHIVDGFMTHNSSESKIETFVSNHIKLGAPLKPTQLLPDTPARLAKAISLLPSEVASILLADQRKLTFLILPDAALPFGMTTRSQGPKQDRSYTIVIYDEHQNLPEDLFIGSVLRELAHVIAKRPPEDEWPNDKGNRARFKERLESRADAMVWKWGLRHYSIRYITATYPSHITDEIIESIGNALLENDLSWDD